jgi:hypothetical protein
MKKITLRECKKMKYQEKRYVCAELKIFMSRGDEEDRIRRLAWSNCQRE